MKKIRRLTLICTFVLILLTLPGAALAEEGLNEVRQLIQNYYLNEVNEQVFKQPSIKETVYALNDPHSIYIEPSNFQDFLTSLDGKYVGVGMYLHQVKDQVQVVNPMPGSPAEKAGLKSGDIVTRVNGVSISGLTSADVAAKIRGPKGSQVTITVIRGKQALDFNLTRDTIDIPSLEYRLIAPGMGYIKLYSFDTGSAGEMEDALNDLITQGMKTLVLDLNNNPGGLLDAAVAIAGNFIPRGPVLYVIRRGGTEYTINSFKVPLGIPVAVLVNQGTASAAEILAGAIQDAKTGFIIGTKTYGKGSVQTVFPLKNGGGLKLTTAKYLTREKQDINFKGLVPDISQANEEKQLETAVKKFGGETSPYDVQLVCGSEVVFVGYRTYNLPVSPYCSYGTVMVPLRSIAQYLGTSTYWDNGVVTIETAGKKLVIKSDKVFLKKPANEIIIGKAVYKNGHLMIPVRILADTLGYQVRWHAKTGSVIIVR